MKRKGTNRRGDVFNVDNKATCNKIAQGKEQIMDKEMDKKGKVDKEKVQEWPWLKEISKKK